MVDFLTDYAYSMDLGLHLLDDPPEECSALLFHDSVAVSFVRSLVG